MALPTAFNSVEDLTRFTSFKQGAGSGVDSVREGTFAFKQFEQALKDARREIYRRTGERDVSEFSEARLDDLREAELWLATARLYPRFGERLILAFPESNLQAVGEVSQGADTPSPYEKGDAWTGQLYQRIRAVGLALLYGQPWSIETVAESETLREPFACLSQYARGNSWNLV